VFGGTDRCVERVPVVRRVVVLALGVDRDDVPVVLRGLVGQRMLLSFRGAYAGMFV
jgi:hypothetical protein